MGTSKGCVWKRCAVLMCIGSVFSVLSISQGARILTIPLISGSHVMTMEQISSALIESGHEVYSAINKDCKGVKGLAAAGVKIIPLDVPSGCFFESKEFTKIVITSMFNFSIGALLKLNYEIFGQYYLDEAEALLNEKMASDLAKLKFDLCIVDGIGATRHMFVLPYKLGIPVISANSPLDRIVTGLPALPSFTPSVMDSVYCNKMTYIERVKNLIKTVIIPIVLPLSSPSTNDILVSKYAPEKPYIPLRQLVQETKLWLFQSDVLLDYPHVSLPHTVDIGGINTKPAKRLPEDLLEFADGAEHGLVIVSFGSIVAEFPREITEKIFQGLKALKQRVVWRYAGPALPDVPTNLKLLKWLPQNDLLGHPNTKVFVTHCGTNGQFEALFHGVPMVGIPLIGDGRYNAKRMEEKDLGIVIDLFTMSPGVLTDAVNKVLNNVTYRDNIKLRSAMFKDRLATPKQTVVHWVEHVLKYGTDHLRSPAVDMPFLQYWCLDVSIPLCLLLLLLFYIMIKVTLKIFRVFWRCICQTLGKKTSQQKKMQ